MVSMYYERLFWPFVLISVRVVSNRSWDFFAFGCVLLYLCVLFFIFKCGFAWVMCKQACCYKSMLNAQHVYSITLCFKEIIWVVLVFPAWLSEGSSLELVEHVFSSLPFSLMNCKWITTKSHKTEWLLLSKIKPVNFRIRFNDGFRVGG